MIDNPITACVVTLNDERSIGACLDSLGICDEVLVVDAHSTDRTREIAAARGARVIERDWAGYRTQRQFAVSLAAHDWILSVHADEQLSPSISSEIRKIRPYGLGQYAGYEIPFVVDPGNRHPLHHLRLFDRRRCAIRGTKIQERIVSFGPVGRLCSPIHHDSRRGIDRESGKPGGSARSIADALHSRGRHT